MMNLAKRYRFFLLTLPALLILYIINADLGREATNVIGISFKEMATVLPPIFILLGLLDVWIPKEVLIKYMGEDSGFKGIILSFILGSVAAGPLYGAFPVALVLTKKGAKFRNILIFIGAWSTMKIPMLLFEISSLGRTFALIRLAINIPGIIIMAFLLDKFVVSKDKENIYKQMETMDK